MLLDIKKVGENFYLVNGEYTASSFNEAVVIAYEKKEKIKEIEDEEKKEFFKGDL